MVSGAYYREETAVIQLIKAPQLLSMIYDLGVAGTICPESRMSAWEFNKRFRGDWDLYAIGPGEHFVEQPDFIVAVTEGNCLHFAGGFRDRPLAAYRREILGLLVSLGGLDGLNAHPVTPAGERLLNLFRRAT